MSYSFDQTRRFLATPSGRLHYHEAGTGGAGRPPLVLLHGSGPGAHGWGNFAGNLPALAARFRVLVLDMPGFGDSDPVADAPMPAAVAALGAFLDGLGIEVADLLGNSMGGLVAAQYAAQQPARVRRLASMGGLGQNLFSPFPSEGLNIMAEFVEQPTRERLAAWMRCMVWDPALVTEAALEARWERAMRPAALAWARRLYSRDMLKAIAAPPPGAPQPWAHLPLIEAPTLLIWGREDRVSPLDRALLPLQLIRHAQLHVLPRCGHWAQVERQAEFESLVTGFFGL